MKEEEPTPVDTTKAAAAPDATPGTGTSSDPLAYNIYVVEGEEALGKDGIVDLMKKTVFATGEEVSGEVTYNDTTKVCTFKTINAGALKYYTVQDYDGEKTSTLWPVTIEVKTATGVEKKTYNLQKGVAIKDKYSYPYFMAADAVPFGEKTSDLSAVADASGEKYTVSLVKNIDGPKAYAAAVKLQVDVDGGADDYADPAPGTIRYTTADGKSLTNDASGKQLYIVPYADFSLIVSSGHTANTLTAVVMNDDDVASKIHERTAVAKFAATATSSLTFDLVATPGTGTKASKCNVNVQPALYGVEVKAPEGDIAVAVKDAKTTNSWIATVGEETLTLYGAGAVLTFYNNGWKWFAKESAANSVINNPDAFSALGQNVEYTVADGDLDKTAAKSDGIITLTAAVKVDDVKATATGEVFYYTSKDTAATGYTSATYPTTPTGTGALNSAASTSAVNYVPAVDADGQPVELYVTTFEENTTLKLDGVEGITLVKADDDVDHNLATNQRMYSMYKFAVSNTTPDLAKDTFKDAIEYQITNPSDITNEYAQSTFTKTVTVGADGKISAKGSLSISLIAPDGVAPTCSNVTPASVDAKIERASSSGPYTLTLSGGKDLKAGDTGSVTVSVGTLDMVINLKFE